MFNRTAQAGSTNTIVTYGSNDYINFTDASSGATYTRCGVDVSADISNISYAVFSEQQQIMADDADYLTDELGNVYFRVLTYTTITLTRPNRI